MKEIKGTSMVKNVNVSLIRQYFLEKKKFTIKELMKLTGLSFPTVNRMIDDMVATKEIYAVGLEESTGGRKPKTYLINPNFINTLCMYISENTLVYQVCNSLGEVITNGEKIKTIPSYIQFIDETIEELVKKYDAIKAIAVGVPGSVSDGTIKYIDTYDELKNYPLQQYLEEKWKIVTCIENDMRALSLGCYRSKKLQDGNIVCVYIGHNGPGCGLIVNGKILRGANQFAGEIGFLPAHNHQNLQKIALEEKDYMASSDYLARIIAPLTVIINPKSIIVYHHDQLPKRDTIVEATKVYVPEVEIPEIEISKNYHSDYFFGLHQLAYERLFPNYNIKSTE